MSWSEVFPILSDDLVSLFEAGATDKERSELDQLFAVSRVFNKSEAGHIVSTSLFWKNIHMDLPRIKISRRAQVLNPHKAGLLRFDPWEHYVEPLLKGAHWLAKNRPDAVFRVYLAGDMKFLVPDLVSAGCEVHLMKSNSLAHNPGAMWRFLALEEEGRMVTVVDADRAADPEPQMAQTEEISRLGLGWWRVPAWGELNELGNTAYRPILGCHFGGVRPFPAAHLMHALIWATRKGKIEHFANLPGRPPTRVHGSIWPDYGFDEWFLLTTLYPRAAFEGILSLVPDDAASKLLPLDIEYVQWANNTSEMVYLRSPGGGCCGGGACGEPGTPGGMEILVPKSPKRDIIAYTYLENCGLGEAAAANIEAMKALGLTVERRIWNGELINESALGDKRQVYYHHWHPQPHERNKKWSRNAFGKAYHIAFYAFETDTVPQEFHLSSKMMNELWVPSNYCRGVFEVTGKPVHVVPHAVSPAQHQLEPLPGSSGKRPLNVLFLFDAWSRLARKNPEAVVRVFQEAFPEEGEARLIIKSHHLSPGDLSKLHKLCGSRHWITILDEFLPESKLNELFFRADILLSLQRSEGFGLNLAKGLGFGVPVVTTGYGGHLDFCKDTAFLVPFDMEESAPHNDFWYPTGRWAAPREGEAVKLMRQVAKQIRDNSSSLARRREKGRRIIAREFSTRRLQERIADRLRGHFSSVIS